MPTSIPTSIAVIGAGMAGITCARRLRDAGLAPVVFEKSRGVGGRLATRRAGGGLAFDHGAQFVTARSRSFRDAMDATMARGAAAGWRPRVRPDRTGRDEWLVGRPAMNALVKTWTAGIPVYSGTRVENLERDAGGWRVRTGTGDAGRFDAVVLTVPAPQARELAAGLPVVADALAGIVMDPCWTLMLATGRPLDTPFDVWRGTNAPLAWACRSSSRPGREHVPECWVVHAAPDWSLEHLERDAEWVAATLTGLFEDLVQAPLARLVHRAAHRWRYALTRTPLGRPFIASDDGTLLAGGDWTAGPRVEFAFASGEAMATALVAGRP